MSAASKIITWEAKCVHIGSWDKNDRSGHHLALQAADRERFGSIKLFTVRAGAGDPSPIPMDARVRVTIEVLADEPAPRVVAQAGQQGG